MDNKQKIINWLGKNPEKQYTMHELSLKLKIPYASFYRSINEIRDLLAISKVGKSKVIKLNRQNKILKSYLAISSDEERKDYLKKYPIIKKIHNELNTEDIVVLFGSYAKKKETEKSDIDIMIINKDGKKTISFSKYELLFKIQINPVFITKNEFRLMLREENENIAKQALHNHIVLNNPDKFWENVLNAIQQRAIQGNV
jgi:predicted nucleotidyltransferase